ncbi:MAG: hypothetical protein AB1589_33695 [Cyanobacteriota bacterium]
MGYNFGPTKSLSTTKTPDGKTQWRTEEPIFPGWSDRSSKVGKLPKGTDSYAHYMRSQVLKQF